MFCDAQMYNGLQFQQFGMLTGQQEGVLLFCFLLKIIIFQRMMEL